MLKIDFDWKKAEKKIRKILALLEPIKAFSGPSLKLLAIIGFVLYCTVYLLKGCPNPIAPREFADYLIFILATSGFLYYAQIRQQKAN